MFASPGSWLPGQILPPLRAAGRASPAAAKTPLPTWGLFRAWSPPARLFRWRRGETEYARHTAIPGPACRQTGRHRRRTRPKVRSGTDCATRSLPSRPTPRVSVYTVMILLGQESRARPTHALTCRARSCRCSFTRSGRSSVEGVEPKAITSTKGGSASAAYPAQKSRCAPRRAIDLYGALRDPLPRGRPPYLLRRGPAINR